MMVYIITDTNPHRIGAYNVLINIVDVNGDPLSIANALLTGETVQLFIII